MEQGASKRELTHRRILDAVGKGFRLRGYGGAGVDSLAGDAGMTSGAFYAHFGSKAAAFRAAIAAGMRELQVGIEAYRREFGADWIGRFANWYLSRERIRDIAGGCAMPGLTPEIARGDAEARDLYEEELLRVARAAAEGIPGDTDLQRRNAAWVYLALLMGGTILSRAVESEQVADEIAAAVRAAASRTA